MKRAIVTRADAKLEYFKFVKPIFVDYAKKCNADFIILDHLPPFFTEDNRPHWRILKVLQLLEKYERVLLLDADMLIMPNCPNLFDIVPEGKIGSIYEDKGSRKASRIDVICKIQNKFGVVDWFSGYTNAGTFLLDRTHKNLFMPGPQRQYWLGWGSVDAHFGWQIHKNKYEVFELPYTYNHMSMFSESWNGHPSRFDSYIIHYAGQVSRWQDYVPGMTKTDFMKNDIRKIYGLEV